jgi:hypothetical protein
MIEKRCGILTVCISFAVLLVALCASPVNAHAQGVPALSFSGQGSNTASVDSTRGYAFNVTAVGGVFVTGLSFYDQGGNGLSQSHEVGIWNSSGTLLASSTVPAGTAAPLDSNGLFREITLALPIFLPAGNSYAVGAFFSGGSADSQAVNWTSMATAPGISYAEVRFVNNSSTLTFPTITSSFLGLPGGSFVVSPVPEPGTLSLLGVGLVAWTVLRRRAARG